MSQPVSSHITERPSPLPVTSDELVETFDLLGDWEQRYGYVIDLGKKLPTYPQQARIDSLKVEGCTAQVWLYPAWDPDESDKIWFYADSDAAIVRGLIAVLMIVFQGQDREKLRTFDMAAFFTELGLDEALSPNRRNGFFAMVDKLTKLAT